MIFDKIINEYNLINSDRKINFVESTNSFNINLIANHYKKTDETILVVLPNLYEAQIYYDNLIELLGEEKVLFYPSDQVLTTLMAVGSSDFKNERLQTIFKLLDNKNYVVVATYQATLLKQLSKNDYVNAIRKVKVGDKINVEEFSSYLTDSGYKFEYIVDSLGTFSIRGSIIDIYINLYENPIRIDLFDDEVESIKFYDIISQRSSDKVDEVKIVPHNEIFYTSKMKDDVIKKINQNFKGLMLSKREEEKLNHDLQKLELKIGQDSISYYIQFFKNEISTILSFLNKYKMYVIDYEKILINIKQEEDDKETFKRSLDGDSFLKFSMYDDVKKLEDANILISNFNIENNQKGHFLQTYEVDNFNYNLEHFYLMYKDIFNQVDLYFNINKESNLEQLKSFLNEKKINRNIYLNKQKFIGSFYNKKYNSLYINEDALFKDHLGRKIYYRSVLAESSKISNVDELNFGEYVVHYTYGIARYLGLKTITLSNGRQDYLQLEYQNKEMLYVPVDQINLVLKYNKTTDQRPSLSKLGGKVWNKTKTDVKKKIKDLSDKLINLYSLREKSVGYSFDKDSEMQIEFENDFNYQLTKDQEIAIIQTKKDMESKRPMDRIVVGDVGFGKTEVALRAAFKAVMDGKQVMYLVPTTILARQHYYTFKKRFEKYGGNITLLSRFVSKKDQTSRLKDIKKGFIDVVIGTHRLLSKDVVFKDLGLLIIDEEQRFGVLDKEKIKEIKVNVDTLTLTATPIPRTLQMSLMGLKEMSMIETAPKNRYPIQTFILEKHDALIKEAIRRELSRGGQVYYLHNRVLSIENVVSYLKNLVPEAKIGFAHGKMTKVQMENTLEAFISREYDVLVSTTIIETGIDIPNTNTLIVEDSDKLGLSQLYQIRGRVGRSDKIAYAYLFYNSYELINEDARKRLEAIKDFTSLGSGYKIALRDLSIRGAGDILGSEQSGFIDSVGIDLYLKLLEEEVTGKSLEDEVIKESEIYSERHVDPSYIKEDKIRIEIHKKIANLESIEQVEKFKDELVDRFGNFDIELTLYMYEKLSKKLQYLLGVRKTEKKKDFMVLNIDQEKSKMISGEKLFEVASKFRYKVELGYLNEEVIIKLHILNKEEHFLYLMCQFLENYLYNEEW